MALDILNTMAYFAHDNIIREMFLSLAGGSQTKLESAINLLVNYSMVNGERKQSLSIHRLVQEVTRLKLQEQQKEEEVLKKALELIKSSTIKKENISHVTSILDYASRYNKLINNFDFTYGGRKYTPLNLLIEGNREEGVKNILDNLRRERYPSKLLKVVNNLDESGYSPLRLAIENSNLQIVKYLIENGADLDIKYEKGFTPLHFAALFGNLELARYLVDEKHVSFNVLDKYGRSPLHIASENGRIELVKYLVGEKKANINVLDNQRMAPLHFVAENGNLELAKYLIENGADFYLRDRFKFTPIERAIDRRQYDIVKYLTEVKDGFGFTYLHKAALEGNLDLLKHLIDHKANLYVLDNYGSSPLHIAAESGKLEIVRYIIDKKLCKIDIVNNDERTPLLLAAQNGHLEIVKFLVDKGADFYLRDRFKFTPIERAIDRRQYDIVKYLTEVKVRSVADECLPSPSYRQKREAESKCLFTWEDVDEFSEEKDERRNLGEIKIDGEKFIDYIKDLPEGKQDQLIQLADKVRIVGNSQGLVSELTSNQKVMNHLSKVGKISVMTMHGMMAKNVLADFLNGDYKGVAINIGFIAGGQGFAKVAESASLKGLKLASEGKLLLGRSLKAASPFLAHGTSAFVVYDLVNQIKAFKNGTEEALVGVVGDSIYLGVDAAEIGVEVAEAFEVLEGVSSVTGPIGATIGAVVFIGTDIYMSVKRFGKIDEIVHLTGREKFIEGLRAFIGMEPEQYIGELMGEKQANDQLVKQGLEYLKQHNDTQRYVFPAVNVKEECERVPSLQGAQYGLREEKCRYSKTVDLNNTVLLDRKVNGIKWSRAKPDNPNGGEIFCFPQGDYQPASNYGVDGRGGENDADPDVIIIPSNSNFHEMHLIVRSSTSIVNHADIGSFNYTILPERGKAQVSITLPSLLIGLPADKHNFFFNFMISDLVGIYIQNISQIFNYTVKSATFSFLSNGNKSERVFDSNFDKGRFNVTISDIPVNVSYILSNGAEIKMGNKGSMYMLENTNKSPEELIKNYLPIANRLNKMSFFIQSLLSNETVVIGSGNCEVIYNNPLHKSHLVGNGGENVYVINSEIDNVPEVVIHDVDEENSIDTIDLRNVVKKARGSFELQVIKSENDLLLKAIVEKHEYFTVKLKDGVERYNKTHVIVENAPMIISVDKDEWSLKPQPLMFEKDKEIIVVTGQDVEKDTELIISRKGGNYTFVRSNSNDLMITNAFDSTISKDDFCSITLSKFYKTPKMKTLSIKFTDKEIVLKDYEKEISTARDINVVKKEYKDQVYNDVFTEVMLSKQPHRHRQHIRNRRMVSSSAKPSSWINNLFGWVKSSVSGLLGSRAALPEEKLNTKSSISQPMDVNGTILLLDMVVRRVTGQRYISTAEQSISPLEAQGYALNITNRFEKVLNKTAIKSGISVTNLNFDPVAVQSAIIGKIINGRFSEIAKTLYSIAKEACPEFKQTDKFLAHLRNQLEGEKETALLQQKVEKPSKVLGQEVLRQVELSKKPDTFLNGTSVVQGISRAIN